MKPLLFLGALGAGAVALFASRKSKASDAEGVTTSSGQAVPATGTNIAAPAKGATTQERLANAISQGPEAMRATAGQLRAEGNDAAANELLSQVTARSVGLPPVTRQTPGGSTVVAPAPVSPADSPAKVRALALTAALNQSPPQRGDGRVMTYQRNEGLVVDGLYGPNTASAVARAGVIPYPPQIYSRNATRRAQSIVDYRALIAQQQATFGGDWSPALRGVPNA